MCSRRHCVCVLIHLFPCIHLRSVWLSLCASVCPDPDKCASTSLLTWNYKTSFSSTSTHQNCDIKLTVTLEVEKCTCVYLLHFKRVRTKIANVCVIFILQQLKMGFHFFEYVCAGSSKQRIKTTYKKFHCTRCSIFDWAYTFKLSKKNCVCLQICWFILFLGM